MESKFRAKVLLYAESYSTNNIVIASALLKQIILLTRIDNPAVTTTHVRELLIECKKQLLKLKGNVTEFNRWVRQQVNKLHAQDQKAMDLRHYLWKAYKPAPDKDFITYIKDKKSQVDDGRPSYNAEEFMTMAENKHEARLLDEDKCLGNTV